MSDNYDIKGYPQLKFYWREKHPVEFYENGVLKIGTIILKKDSNGDTIPVVMEDINGREVALRSYMRIELREDGKLIRYTQFEKPKEN